MVRRIGSNTPSIDAPETYDISQKMYAQMGQSVAQAASASMQALGGLNAAYDANARRQMSLLAEQEELNAARAKASQSQGSVGALGGILNGVVGGLAAYEEITKQREALEFEKSMKQQQMNLQERQFAHGVQMDVQQQQLRGQQFEYEQQQAQNKATLDEGKSLIEAAAAQLSADLEVNLFQMSAQEGIAYTVQQVARIQEEYGSLFAANPQLKNQFNAAIASAQQSIYRHYGKEFRGEMDLQRRLAVEVMNQKVSIAFADRYAEIAYGAGVMTAEQANASLNDIINQSVAIAQQDKGFMLAIKQNPGLINEFYKNLFAHAGEMYQSFADKNAEFGATSQKIQYINNIIGRLGYIDDAATVGYLQEEFAKLGLPFEDPRNWGTTMVSTMKNQAQSIELEQQLMVAVDDNDPMFANTPESQIVRNANHANLIFDAVNQNNNTNMEWLESHYKTQLSQAKEKKQYGRVEYYETGLNLISSYRDTTKQHNTLKAQIVDAQQEYARAVRPADPNAVVNDPATGAPIRLTIGGNEAMPRSTPEEIEALKGRLQDLHAQEGQLVQDAATKFGVNLNNTKDESYIKLIRDGAKQYTDTLIQRNMENGRTTNSMGAVQSVPLNTPPPTDDRQGARPVNFSGGRVSNEEVVAGQTGTLPFQTSPVPLANATPFQGGVATASNVGFVPFKGGEVKIVSNPGSKGLTLQSSDPRVATMVGGKVIYAGKTETLGNVVVLQTKDGLAEVYTNLNNINSTVVKGAYMKPGVELGLAKDKMEFQVWQTNDPLRSLRLEIPRNETSPVAYLQGISGFRQAPSGLGTIDILNNKPTPVVGTNNNIFAGDGYTIYGDLLVTKNGKQRRLTPKEFSALYPNGMKQAQSYVQQKQQQANYSNNQPNVTVEQAQAYAAEVSKKYKGVKNMCAASVKAFGEKIGIDTAKMDLTADSSKRLGTVMTDFSQIQPGDIIGWSGGSSFGDEHVGIYMGGTKVFHQSSARGLAAGIYDDFDYFKKQKSAYFVRPQKSGNIPPPTTTSEYSRTGQREPARNASRRRDSFMELSNDPVTRGLLTDNPQGLANLRAFADIIAYAEGHGRPTQYNTRLGWKTIDTSRPHPGRDASGRYQYIPSTWKGLWGGQNVPMTPENQDKAFIKLLQTQIPGLYEMVVAGDFDKAFAKATWIWASIKGNNYTYNGKPQGKYDPSQLANQARTAAQSYMRGDANMYDGRTPVTNAPLHQVNAANSQSAYGKPSPNHNFGYAALVRNDYLRKTIYSVAVKTGVPQQMIADVVARQTTNFTDISGINEATIRGYIGQQSVRDIPSQRTPVNQPTPQQLIPNQRTSVGRRYNSGNARQRKEWHFSKRSNCPTCQSLPVFLPHYVNK